MFQFLDFNGLTDSEIELRIKEKLPADALKKFVPAYSFSIHLLGKEEIIGFLNLRVGFNESIVYAGNIGYSINEAYRGNHYAQKACEIVIKVARAHGMKELVITCNPDNMPSRRTCERLGASLLEVVDLPEWTEMYQEGERQKCRYQLCL